MELERLPRELLFEELQYLDFPSINNLCKTNRYFAQRCRQQPFNALIQRKRRRYRREVREREQSRLIKLFEDLLYSDAYTSIELKSGTILPRVHYSGSRFFTIVYSYGLDEEDMDGERALEFIEEEIDYDRTIRVYPRDWEDPAIIELQQLPEVKIGRIDLKHLILPVRDILDALVEEEFQQ